MARDISFDERRKQRKSEDQEDEALEDRKKSIGLDGRTSIGLTKTGDPATDKLIELFLRAEPLIDQLNSLYNQYIAGVELRPPAERRKQLDQTMVSLQMMNKPTPAYQFRYASLNGSYLTHRDRWDRLCKDLESGKIKRVAGPKRKSG